MTRASKQNAGAVPDPQTEPHRVRIDPSDLALEIVSIVIAIVLATAVGQAVDRYRESARTHEALVQIRAEISSDDVELRAGHPLHLRVREAFAKTVRNAKDERLGFDTLARTFANTAPRGFHPFVSTTTAWQLSQSSSVLADVPYQLRATLQRRYTQAVLLSQTNGGVIGQLQTAPSQDRPNFFFTAYALSLILTDVTSSEIQLAADDTAALKALDDAGIR